MTTNLWVTLVVCVWACQLFRTYAGETGHMITDNSDIPNVKPTATKGMIIDGGSGGSRLHIYTWKPRVFHTVPPPLSYPESNEQWNGRIDPGIHTYANNYAGIKNHLAQLIDFAKMSLVGFEKEFGDYPIYFKATGGMRELDAHTRESMVAYIRVLLSDKSFCPFFFRDDFARVISGEEEAIFSWAATNFLMGTLISNSQGMGTVENVNTTYGTLDLGGASTQIAFYVPSQDILEGLTKFQIGGQKQWNVYTRSFLQFGINSARERHIRQLVDKFIAAQGMSANPTTRYTVVNDCFHTGYSEEAWDSTGQHAVDVVGPPNPSVNQLQNCRRLLEPLMERELDSFCNKVFHGDCSLVGAYQPPVPVGRHGHFIGTSSYKYPWSFLLLPKTATLEQMATQATKICSKNFGEINYYYVSNGLNANNDKLGDYLPYYCFLSAYVLTLLEDGYKFNQTQTLTVMDEVNGHKVGWALGAILYEINELPWVLQLSVVERHPLGFVFFAGVVGFFLGVAAAVVVYREITMDDPHRYNKPNDAQHTIININTSSGGSERSSKQPSRTPSRDENGFVGLQRTNTMEMIRYHSFQGGPETTPQPSKAKGSNNGNAGKSGDKGLALQPLSRANSNVSSTMSTPVYNNAPHSTSGTKLGSSFQSQGMLPPNGSANSRAGSTNPSRQNSFLATKSSGGAPPAGGTGSQNAFYIGSLSESGSGSDRKGGPSSNSNWGAPWVSPAAADEATPFFRHDGPASSSNMIDPHVLAAHKTRGPTSVAIPQMKRSASSGSSSSSSDGDDARHRHHRPHHASKPFPSSMSRGESGGDTTGRAGTVYGRIPSDGY